MIDHQVIEILNRLFYYTDYQIWDKLKDEVFDDEIYIDMTSLGAPKAETLSAQQLCQNWASGFEGIDAIHHQAGNYIIRLVENIAYANVYAIASHYKESATKGTTREFVGTYNFKLKMTERGWRLFSFLFSLRYINGNIELV